MNEHLATVDWEDLQSLCEDDIDGCLFLQLFLLTILQLTLLYSPPKEREKGSQRSRKEREKYCLKRSRRKLNAQISMLTQRNPTSANLPKLQHKVSLLTYDIRDMIMKDLNSKEVRAVDTIKTNPRYFYSYAKRFAKTKSSVSPLKKEGDDLTNDPAEKAELLQAQYVKVFSNPEEANLKKAVENVKLQIPDSDALHDFSFSEEDIIKAIKELDPYSATPDGDIPAMILCSCKEQLSRPLFMMWNKSFQTSIIPHCLKKQYITPVYKKGNRTEPANYRPVSITSHLIKIFERVLRTRLVDYLEDRNMLSENQHGFRKKRSCLTQLIAHVEHIFQCLNSGEEVDVVYLDYAKAFDKVDHKILLAKLEKYGIRGKFFNWIKEFLTNREQTVVVEGHKAATKPVESGVPQGTVLGPILFILDVNDIYLILQSAKGLSFADDTKLKKAIRGVLDQLLLQEDLNNVISWSKDNNMQLHEKKFEVLNYSLNSSLLLRNLPHTAECMQYSTSDGYIIDPTSVVRDLGVHLSDDCTWTAHINVTVQEARKKASWVLSVFRDRSQLLMTTLFKTLVRSKLEYCCPVWDPAKVGEIQAIESVQRSFTRKITACRDLDYWERLKKLRLLSLQRRRERYTIIHTWKMLHEHAPNDIDMKFYTNNRMGTKATVPVFKNKAQRSVSTLYDNSFSVKAARLWNILPKDVNQQETLDGFKEALGSFICKFPDTPPVPGYTAVNRNSLLDWASERVTLQEDAHDAVVRM